MTDYTWPSTVYPASAALTWKDNTVSFHSPLSGTVRTESRPGGRWHLSVTVDGLMNDSQSNKPSTHLIEAFLFRLDGKKNRAVIPDFGYVRSGPGTGYNPPTIVPSVFGAGQTGLSLNTNGWAYSTTVLYAGDRIGISGQMIPVVSDVTSNGSGAATLTLAHPVRTAPTNGAALELDAPTARFILSNQASFSARPGMVKSILVEFEEVIP